MASWDDQGDPRGRRDEDHGGDPLAGVIDRIRRALSAWRYDVHDEENGEPEGYPDGVREHLRGTGEFYTEGTVWTPGSPKPEDWGNLGNFPSDPQHQTPAPSPARSGDTRPPGYHGPRAGNHGRRARRDRPWWRFW